MTLFTFYVFQNKNKIRISAIRISVGEIRRGGGGGFKNMQTISLTSRQAKITAPTFLAFGKKAEEYSKCTGLEC